MTAPNAVSIPRRAAGTLLDLFSSVRFGIALLIALFLYSSIGSAGILYPTSINFLDLDNWEQIVPRQARWAEMTEFEWFHWWPFDLLMALICATLVVTTLRRIRFKAINYGVWMIHTGIVILCLGSVRYFSAKVEGDAPVARRNLVIEAPGFEPVTLLAQPGAAVTLGNAASGYSFRIDDIDPDWEMLTGDARGSRAYSVSVSVRTPQRSFTRQLLAGYPELTEDILPGQGRAVKVTGERLVDSSLAIRLEYAPQSHFYLANSAAIYVREKGDTTWVERPIDWLPRYNDTVASLDTVWLTTTGSAPREQSLEIELPPAGKDDPWPEMFLIDSYLRYAVNQMRQVAGDGAFDPFISIRLLSSADQPWRMDLRASDPQGDLVAFQWINEEAQLEALQRTEPGRLTIEVPGAGPPLSLTKADMQLDAPDREFTAIPGTPYSFRVRAVEDAPTDADGRALAAVAVVDLRRDGVEFTRFVSDSARQAQDNRVDPDSGDMTPMALDPGIIVSYAGATRHRPLTIVAGPVETQIRVVVADVASGQTRVLPVVPGTPVEVLAGWTLVVDQFLTHPVELVKPVVVPFEQRNRDLDMRLRMVRVLVPGRSGDVPLWLRFHDYPFDDEKSALRRFEYEPTSIRLSDGREIEMIFSRRRMELPAPVVLEDFVLEEHIGGFTGSNVSVRDWRSVVRFDAPEGLSEPINVSINKPGEFDGYWFFQSMWDPPDPPRTAGDAGSRGRNYTVLGVGNREGVHIQLLGCAIAVVGMLYAFYVKPVIKRRRMAAVQASILENEPADTRPAATPEPVVAGTEERP